LFYSNIANKIGGALYLNYVYANRIIVDNLSNTDYNITNPANITIVRNSSCLQKNVFINNAAQFGGAAIAINGFNVSNLANGNTSGSCPYL
jgi:hypothetical protein